MIDGYKTALKAIALRKAGFDDAARHLARLARKLGFAVPPRTVELPALPGFSADDLDGLGIRHRRASDGLVIVRRVR